MRYRTISKCRICGSSRIDTILDLGNHPLANSLKKRQYEKEVRFPLTLAFCRDCALVQIKETVNKEMLFRRYFWVTSTSRTAREFSEIFFKKTMNTVKLKKEEFVLEIASNDGTYLKSFLSAGLNVLGVDSAENIVQIANSAGVPTISAFWNEKTAQRIEKKFGKAKFLFARNVLAHVSQLDEVVLGIQRILAENGVGAVEFHYAGTILKELQYDSIYHEHLCYFSIQTAERLLNQFGLHVFHIEMSPISGGAYILYFSKNARQKTVQYNKLKKQETALSINRFTLWKKFALRCIQHKKLSQKMFNSFNGQRIAGFGSSARSSTYLNFCGFDQADISAIIDNNRLKHGFYSAGSSIPIVSKEEGLRLKPDILFILAWNFKDEIIKECRAMGFKGKYLIPFPKKIYLVKK